MGVSGECDMSQVGHRPVDVDVPPAQIDADSECCKANHDSPRLENDILSQASSSNHTSSATSQPWISGRTQCLRFETITDRESRLAVLAMKIVIVLGDLGAVALVVVKQNPRAEELIVMNRNFVVTQVVFNAVLLFALLSGFVVWVARVASSYRHRMMWTKRRTGVAQLTVTRGALVLGIIAGQLALNLYLLNRPAGFCQSYVLPLIDNFTWMCWNFMLLTLVIEAHGTNLVRDSKRTGRRDSVVFDLPLSVHWPKLILWTPFTASLVWACVMAMEDGRTVQVTHVGGGECTWGAKLECSLSKSMWRANLLLYIFVGIYFSAYTFFLRRGWRQLKKVPYQRYRMANLVLRFQMRFNGCMMMGLLVGITLTGLVGNKLCVNITATGLGNPATSLIFVAMQLVQFCLAFPRRHDYLETRHALPALLLQQFAWTEADVAPRRSAWQSALGPAAAATAAESAAESVAATAAGRHSAAGSPQSTVAPLFCFETAIKLFFWSVLVYAYQEEADTVSLAAMPAAIREVLGEMDAAMRLYGLRKRRLFYDRACGTKALVAWSDSVIVLSFRGTAEMVNFIQDAKFLQTPHPPARKFRGRTPCVHQGFLTTWRATGVHDQVLSLLRDLLAAAPNPDAVRVLCTGHSLGGAVAQLASFDIARELGVPPAMMSVYTFGCPRIGNRALAAESAEVVPDTWHVINDQDVVTRGMKIFGMYKRAGQRVIVNSNGDLIVRPAHFETSLLQAGFGVFIRTHRGAAMHATVAYQSALVAILTAQLRDSSRQAEGLHGLLSLLKQLPQVRVALESHAQKLGTSFAMLVRGIAVSALRPGDPYDTSPRSRATFSNQRFTASRHASLLRAAGAAPVEGAEAVGAPGGRDGSYSDSLDGVIPVAIIDDQALNDQGATMVDAVVVVDVKREEGDGRDDSQPGSPSPR